MWSGRGVAGIVGSVLSLGSCLAAPPAAPTAATSGREVAADSPKPVAPSSSSNEAKNRRRVRVEVSAAGLAVDGENVGSDQAALKAALLRAGGAIIDVRAEPDAPPSLVLAALTVDAGPQVTRRRLRWQDVKLKLSEDPPAIGSKLHPASIFSWRGNHVTELWSISREPALTNLGPFEPGDPKAEPAVIASLTQACAPSGCQLVVQLRDERLLDALRDWQRVAAAVGPRLRLQVFNGEGFVGRLPPQVIQSVVLTGFGRMRTCYEAGLGRDPKLKGRVSVKFTIELDGTVKNAHDGGSAIPDTTVRDCIMHEFFGFKFPPPDSGIVTVVYPIMLAPG